MPQPKLTVDCLPITTVNSTVGRTCALAVQQRKEKLRTYRTKAGIPVWAEPTRKNQILLRFRPGEGEEHTLTVTEAHLQKLVTSGDLTAV